MEISFFRVLFLLASVWNLAGAAFGFFNTAFTYELIFSGELTDPLLFVVYKGAWGTTLTYVIGYFIVACNPAKHYGVVVTGSIGKLGFIASLLQLYSMGLAGSIIFVIVVGDAVFIGLFMYYLVRVYKSKGQYTDECEVSA